jgi:hypothetical protein
VKNENRKSDQSHSVFNGMYCDAVRYYRGYIVGNLRRMKMFSTKKQIEATERAKAYAGLEDDKTNPIYRNYMKELGFKPVVKNGIFTGKVVEIHKTIVYCRFSPRPSTL